MNTSLLTVASMIVLLSIGIGIGWGFQTTVVTTPAVTVSVTQTTTATQTPGSNQEPYVLTLVLTTGSIYNSTVGDQPAFFVLTPHGLQSSTHIDLPANRLIELVIVNYDDGNATLTSPQYANVQGTVNGTISYANDDNVNSSQGPNGIVVKGGATVSSVPVSDIAHTFTIPSLGINIPIPVSSTVTAFIKITQAGTYTWFCETTCGSGDTGLEGAMATTGWMTGSIVVS
jgi:heme/copper-type cytochrome/quinol oxidase subunit 2